MGLLLALAKSLFMVISVTLTAKVLSPTLEVMRPSMAPCSASNSCSLCRRPWWSLLQASTDTTDSRARTTTGPSTKRANVSTRYRTGSPSGAVGKCKKEICIVWNWGKNIYSKEKSYRTVQFPCRHKAPDGSRDIRYSLVVLLLHLSWEQHWIAWW